ncbi:hypothetical protein [Streptomyces sp. NPDC005953]|uniref:hypothetical protein n=1 Tax=Streptomyces sp. NPDC005953 TaxID=3156719 RepID=UPI0033E840E4
MTSYFQRYASGQHEAVWRELRALGPVPPALHDDVAAVCAVTMERVAGQVARLAAMLPELGFVGVDVPLHRPPTDADRRTVAELDEEIGGLPAALTACLQVVGGVSFLGDWEAINLHYQHGPGQSTMPPGPEYPDPLWLCDAALLRCEWEEFQEEPDEDGFLFVVAPDELHKANVSGGSHDVALPDRCADPVLLGVAGRPGITLVEYLRESIAWGGFPGWSFHGGAAPDALAPLRAQPDF